MMLTYCSRQRLPLCLARRAINMLCQALQSLMCISQSINIACRVLLCPMHISRSANIACQALPCPIYLSQSAFGPQMPAQWTRLLLQCTLLLKQWLSLTHLVPWSFLHPLNIVLQQFELLRPREIYRYVNR